MELLAISSTGLSRVPGNSGIVAIGGAKSTGIKVPGLKSPEDYAVVAANGDGFQIHPIKGRRSGKAELGANGVLAIEDLILCAVESTGSETGVRRDSEGVDELLRHFSASGSLEPALTWFLRHLIDTAEMEKGLLITRSLDGSFQAQIKIGLKSGDPWLSEALIQETLSSGRPQWIQNRIGSNLERSKSLVAAGFLSVFSLPLVARGEVLGAVIAGSTRPHSGLSLEQKRHMETLVQLGALMFWFHRRESLAQKEIQRLSKTQAGLESCPMESASSKLIRELEIARRIANTSLSALIQGETGVGKERMAQWLHEQSDRKKAAFIAINCAAIPGDLLESILFGHKKGAFTGAVSDQPGKFQLAHGGSILLDEIGDLSPRLQAKLLRVLQEGVIDPVGSSRPVKVDVRVIAATHRNLPELVSQGKFRQDLYYRIAETVLTIPPLRERPEDIALLATRFLYELSAERRISPEALQWLSQRPWPGNVRELRSAVRRAAAISAGEELCVSDFLIGLPEESESKGANWLGGNSLEEAKQQFVRDKIRLALERAGGNKQKAADLLGVTARTLFRYLETEKGEEDVLLRDSIVAPANKDREDSVEISGLWRKQ